MHFRDVVILLVAALLAFAALSPAHGNGPCFCLCDWHELFGTEEPHPSDGVAHCDEDVPLHRGHGFPTALPPAAEAPRCFLAAPGVGSSLHHALRMPARGGTSASRAAALALRI